MKLDKRAECEDLLDDVHDMLEHNDGLVSELAEIDGATMQLTHKVLLQSRVGGVKWEGGKDGRERDGEEGQFREGVGSPRLVEVYDRLDGIGQVDGPPPKTSEEVNRITLYPLYPKPRTRPSRCCLTSRRRGMA